MSDQEQRYRRAKEVLSGADWVFDAYVNAQMAKVLASEVGPAGAADREAAHARARIATEVKAALMSTVDEYETDQRLKDRRDQQKEGRDGR